jgi:hypothetical protein
MLQPVPNNDLRVRPSLRVIGALGSVLLSFVFAHASFPFFSAPKVLPENCSRQSRGRLICEFGNILMSLLPDSVQGPAEAISGLLLAALFLYVAWLLIRPLLARARQPLR